MIMRLAKIAENHLITSIRNSVWGSTQLFKNWNEGDLLVLYVNGEIAAIGSVCGLEYVSNEIIWDNGLFKHRIPINFTHVFTSGNRIPLKGKIRDSLYDTYGSKYGVIILNKYPISEKIADIIWSEIKKHDNDLDKMNI